MNLLQASPYILVIALLLALIVYLLKTVLSEANKRCTALTEDRDRMLQNLLDVQREKAKLQAEMEALIERKRHTGPTIAGLEDLSAVLSRLKNNRQVEDVLIDACLNTAHELRQGPYSYDPEKPSGEREDFK